MGVKVFDIISKENIDFSDLENKTLVFDASLTIHQFLSTIRQADGSLLTDRKGHVTSHLVGLFSRITNFMQKDINMIFVFDGKAPELKRREQERRKQLKHEAELNYEKAKEEDNIEAMKKYASRVSYINEDIINESKKLLASFGIPIVQAPSEADAEIAYIAKKGDAYACATQDADILMYGAPKIVRNLSVSLKKKVSAKYQNVNIELIKLSDVLNELGVDQNQFIILCILIGTDYNVGGIKGIGAKKALTLVKKYGYDFDALFKDVKWSDSFDYPWEDVYNTIKNMPVTDDYDLAQKQINKKEIIDLLCENHNFSEENVISKIDKLLEKQNKKINKQSLSLNKWF